MSGPADLAATVRAALADYNIHDLGEAERCAGALDALAELVRLAEQRGEALERICETARKGKIEVERVTAKSPVGTTENVAAHHFNVIRSIAEAEVSA